MGEQEAEADWHGWSLGNGHENRYAIHISYLPLRKAACLYVVDGSVLRVLAYFRSEAAALEMLGFMDAMMKVANGG